MFKRVLLASAALALTTAEIERQGTGTAIIRG